MNTFFSIRRVIAHYGVRGFDVSKACSDEQVGYCPIHKGEGEWSLHVDFIRHIFHCSKCHAKGNVVDFVAAMEQCNLHDAELKLEEWFGK